MGMPQRRDRDGRYATQTWAEPDFSLALSSLGLEDITPQKMLDVAERSARRLAVNSPHLDADDVTQDIIAHYLVSRRNAARDLSEAYSNGRAVTPGAVLQNPVAYIRRVAHGIGQRHMTGEQQSPDRSAIKRFAQTVKELEQSRGERLSDAEKRQIADQIRSEQPPGRRAKPDFYVRYTETPSGLGGSTGEGPSDDDTPMHQIESAAGADGRPVGTFAGSDDYQTGTIGDQVLVGMAEGRAGAAKNARLRAWDALAEQAGAPMVTFGAVGETAATAHRKTIAAGGGAVAVSRRVAAGKATKDETTALLAPFGGAKLDYEDQMKVVDQFSRLESYADDVYESALSAATSRRNRKPEQALT